MDVYLRHVVNRTSERFVSFNHGVIQKNSQLLFGVPCPWTKVMNSR